MALKKSTFRKIRVLSVILSFFYFGGLIWYGELIFSRPFPLLLLLVSTGLALLIAPLLPDVLLSLPLIRFLSVLLIGTGISGSLYMIVDAIMATIYFGDLLVEIIQHVFIIFVLVLLGIRVVSPQFARDNT